MANEAIPVENTGIAANVRRYTVAPGIAITKYSLMALAGDNTASGGTALTSGGLFAGIALAAKDASDTNNTEIACDIGGVWDLTASGTIGLGTKVALAGGNKIQSVDAGLLAALWASGARIVGTAMEAASDGEVVRVDLDRT